MAEKASLAAASDVHCFAVEEIFFDMVYWHLTFEAYEVRRLLRFAVCFFTAQCTLVHLRGLGIACRLSVRLSVTLVICDHIGWKAWKPIAQTISPARSLFVAKRRSTYSQGNMGKFWGD